MCTVFCLIYLPLSPSLSSSSSLDSVTHLCSPWALRFYDFGSSNTSLAKPRSWTDRWAAGQRALHEKATWCLFGASVPIPLGPSSCPSMRSGQVASVLPDSCFRPYSCSSSPHPSFFFSLCVISSFLVRRGTRSPVKFIFLSLSSNSPIR